MKLFQFCAILTILAGAGSVRAQSDSTEEYNVNPERGTADREDVWTLNFRFYDPRIIVERVPGRGTKIVWYMLYSVYNTDPKKDVHTFVPDIELVTLDRHTRHADEIMPSLQTAIQKREDPTGRLNIHNSVTVMEKPIPLSKEDAFPRVVNGVAIWTDVDPAPSEKAKQPRTNKFSIFIAGLSNGYTDSERDPTTNKPIIKRKTLQLDFERLGDGERIDPSGIRWTGKYTWIYRETTPVDPLPLKKDEKDPQLNLFPSLKLNNLPKQTVSEPILPITDKR
ncbi:MAG: hypothetical protein R3B84_16600 [Zavarzinella sp.]